MAMKTHHVFSDQVFDSEWACQQSQSIIENFEGTPAPAYSIPLRQPSFSSDYVSYTFHRDTQQPLMKTFVDLIDKQKDNFLKIFPHHSWGFEFVNFIYVKEANKQFSWPHRDQVFFHGTWHLTLQGASNIMVINDSDNSEQLLQFESGTLWFLDSGRFQHYVAASKENISRFELCAMWNLAPKVNEHQRDRVSNDDSKFVRLPSNEAHLREQLFNELKKTWTPVI